LIFGSVYTSATGTGAQNGSAGLWIGYDMLFYKTMTTLEKTSAEIRRLVARLNKSFVACESCNIRDFPKITLEDVLEAIDENIEDDGYAEVLHIRGGSGYCLWHDLKGSCVWELGKPYDQQKPEVHEFVANILFSK
jgi:hypothetical protein